MRNISSNIKTIINNNNSFIITVDLTLWKWYNIQSIVLSIQCDYNLVCGKGGGMTHKNINRPICNNTTATVYLNKAPLVGINKRS